MENHKAGGMCDEKWKFLTFFYFSFEEKIKAWKSRWIKTRFYLKEVDKYKDKNNQQMMPGRNVWAISYLSFCLYTWPPS